ncbi:MAG: hypothetical protein QOF17_1326 [Solirubrobacteraceae bacterium]|nr:hypothetical protein [Solirubrobacteraceae bacterium]
MAGFKDNNLDDRRSAAANAKQALLDKFRAQAAKAGDPAVQARDAERKAAREAEAKQREEDAKREAAERVAREAKEKADQEAQRSALEAEQKQKRDERYAARKKKR